MKKGEWIERLRSDDFREPLVGETVDTPEGEGTIIDVGEWRSFPMYDGDNFREVQYKLSSILGGNWPDIYYRVTVKFPDSEVAAYNIWQIRYDLDKDATDHPWR